MGSFPFNANQRLKTIAGRVTKTLQVDADYAIDPELDYNLEVNSQAAPITLTLPLGVDGQEFYIQDATGSAQTNNITISPTAPNIIVQPSPNITENYGSRRYVFKTVTIPGPVTFGVWYYQQDASAGAIPTGDPNTLAYFDAAGNLADNLSAKFDGANNALAFGLESIGGSIVAAGVAGGLAAGSATDASSLILAGSTGSFAQGEALLAGNITAVANGAHARGVANAGSIGANAQGSLVQGAASNGGQISSSGSAIGSIAGGDAADAGSSISSQERGALALGQVTTGGIIVSSGVGSSAHGAAFGAGSQVLASGYASHALGGAFSAGIVDANGTASLALGAVSAGGVVTSIGKASFAQGNTDATGAIQANGDGSFAGGASTDTGSLINAQVPASMACGSASGGSTIIASGTASLARGISSNAGAIAASGEGSIAVGSVSGTLCNITSASTGAFAFGSVTSSAPAFPSAVEANGEGTLAFGQALEGGQIQSGGPGALAFGSVVSDGTQFAVITAGSGSLAFGNCVNGGTIQSNGGGIAFGFVTDTGSTLRASGTSALAFGVCSGGALFEASGNVSIAIGRATNADPMESSGLMSFSFGESIQNDTFICLALGRFADINGTGNAWVDTDLLLVLGNGVSGSNSNAFAIAKNGDMRLSRTVTPGGTTGAQTIDKPAGSVNIAALQSSIVVTNSLVTPDSIILCSILTSDLTAVLKNVVPGTGSFTINLTVAATAETKIAFMVTN